MSRRLKATSTSAITSAIVVASLASGVVQASQPSAVEKRALSAKAAPASPAAEVKAPPPPAPPTAPTELKLPPAFWEGKPKLEAKLRDDRAVLVSVRTEKGVVDSKADLFTINGVGWVKRDALSVFRLSQQYERLKDVSDMFREVKFEAKTNRVFVICQALGYQARMLLAVRAIESSAGATAHRISFEVIDGHFVGLKGIMSFRQLSASGRSSEPAPTEVTFRVHLEAREIPIPRFLVGFALEVLVQKVAVKMRTHFEEANVEQPPEAEKVL